MAYDGFTLSNIKGEKTMGLIQGWLKRQEDKQEQRAVERRNAERRALCVEFSRNKSRQGAIIARLAELSGEANLKAAADRIGYELEGICRRVHADSIRSIPPAPQAHDHFNADLKHFRKEYCA